MEVDGGLDTQQVLSLFDLDRYREDFPDNTVQKTIGIGNTTPSTLDQENARYKNSRKTEDDLRNEIKHTPGDKLEDKCYNACKAWMHIDQKSDPSLEKDRIMKKISDQSASNVLSAY